MDKEVCIEQMSYIEVPAVHGSFQLKTKRMKVKEWCIALDNVSSYIDSVLGLRYKFLKGERATKEKVFSMIPSMTEEEYARYFRPATKEEINGEFEWDGYQYILKNCIEQLKK